ncbi:hypothetical protein DPEC_G00165230 [Dallia pectoralis]|uniref:Uncharacterized protein n=1 Tax=Dallia pectoralis TaxID=75939 RepID=A0ACC2GHV8_DALPE|nr:hypothetical protein DPEC_G00165230 [Dallia pectoralis]
MQSNSRPQFGEWLIALVRTHQYGLRFVGENKFRVPWKHNSRKDCSADDSRIFREWAVVSGKIKEHPNDKAKWKTNFRCALNNLSKRYKMIEDHSKDSDDPHKVYQIINNDYNYENQPIEEIPIEGISIEDDSIDIYCSLTPRDYLLPGMEQLEELNFTNLTLDTFDLNNHHPVVPSDCYLNQPFPEPVSNPSLPEPTAVSKNNSPPPQQPYYEVNQDALLYQPTTQPSFLGLEMTISYRKKEMLKTQVFSPRVQLHYQCDFSDSLEASAHKVRFPDTDSLLDHKQIELTNRILGSIKRGLLLEIRNTGIYGYRQDKCHVYASTRDPGEVHPEPRKMNQTEPVQLLSFHQFDKDLIAFKEHRQGSPDYTIHMCFGEIFPDGKPLEKKLIYVKVVPLICRLYHEMAQGEGASSLHNDNISLQISHHSSLMELIDATWPDGPQCTMEQYL